MHLTLSHTHTMHTHMLILKHLGGATSCRCIVQYWFDSGHEHRVLIKSHGNSKKRKQSFCRTHPSTMKALKEEAQIYPPKQAVNVVYEEKGGMMGAKHLGELPRNRDQVSKIHRSISSNLPICSSKGVRDPLW